MDQSGNDLVLPSSTWSSEGAPAIATPGASAAIRTIRAPAYFRLEADKSGDARTAPSTERLSNQ